jgi:hypothetical protein
LFFPTWGKATIVIRQGMTQGKALYEFRQPATATSTSFADIRVR